MLGNAAAMVPFVCWIGLEIWGFSYTASRGTERFGIDFDGKDSLELQPGGITRRDIDTY